MRATLGQIMAEVGVIIEVQVCYFLPYSPAIHLVEHLIHKVRQRYFHHAPAKKGYRWHSPGIGRSNSPQVVVRRTGNE